MDLQVDRSCPTLQFYRLGVARKLCSFMDPMHFFGLAFTFHLRRSISSRELLESGVISPCGLGGILASALDVSPEDKPEASEKNDA